MSAIPNADTGFVQLIVVAALATLGGLLTANLMAATHTSRQTAALERLVRSETIGTSGAYRLAAAIGDPADALENQALHGAVNVGVGGTGMSLRIETSGSKIDVLAAEMVLIEGYVSQSGLAPSAAATLLANISEARTRSDGAEALEAVRVALAGILPIADIERDFTRFGGPGIDPSYASAHVLHAIPDLSPADAARIAAAAPEDRAKDALSRYFSSTGRRFSLVTRIVWAPNETSERRLPIEISTAGQVIVLAGSY